MLLFLLFVLFLLASLVILIDKVSIPGFFPAVWKVIFPLHSPCTGIEVAIVAGFHLFPFRTEQLSPPAPMVLQCNAGE